ARVVQPVGIELDMTVGIDIHPLQPLRTLERERMPARRAVPRLPLDILPLELERHNDRKYRLATPPHDDARGVVRMILRGQRLVRIGLTHELATLRTVDVTRRRLGELARHVVDLVIDEL